VTDLTPLLTVRLTGEVPGLASVHGVAELQPLIERNLLPQRLPAGFVLWLGDDAETHGELTAFSQLVTVTYGIVLVSRDGGDGRGGRTAARQATLRDAIHAALAGWTPDSGFAPLDYRQGRRVAVTAEAVFDQLDFSTWTERAA